jgi:hypothetical protein
MTIYEVGLQEIYLTHFNSDFSEGFTTLDQILYRGGEDLTSKCLISRLMR